MCGRITATRKFISIDWPGRNRKNCALSFLTYLRAVNELRERPRWYHATLDNCTTNIRVNAQASGFAILWNWRMLVNGHLDELLYRRGMIPSVAPVRRNQGPRSDQ